jgi:DNA-binding transcriptional ArsR family regulator
MTLLDGTALPAGQLAIIAHIAPQTASSHLSKLVSGRLLAVEQQGRHRYYRLADIHVADAIEALLSITPRLKRLSGRHDVPMRPIEYARTCYAHLAGRLAVEIADALRKRDFLRAGHRSNTK